MPRSHCILKASFLTSPFSRIVFTSFVVTALWLHFLPLKVRFMLIITGVQARGSSKGKFQKAPYLIFLSGNRSQYKKISLRLFWFKVSFVAYRLAASLTLRIKPRAPNCLPLAAQLPPAPWTPCHSAPGPCAHCSLCWGRVGGSLFI